MNKEILPNPRLIQADEKDHTRGKDYIVAVGANEVLNDHLATKRPGAYGTNLGHIRHLLESPNTDTKMRGRESINGYLRRHPEVTTKRRKTLFRIADKLEQKGVFGLVDDLLAPRPTRDDKQSYWGYGHYRNMNAAEKSAYRHAQGYDR